MTTQAAKKRAPKRTRTPASVATTTAEDAVTPRKSVLASARQETAIVDRYLEALSARKGKRGRRRKPETVERRLAEVEAALQDARGVERVLLVQRRMDLNAQLDELLAEPDLAALEAAFVGVVYNYSKRNGLSYAAWREIGVSAAALKAGGVRRAKEA